MKAAKFDWHGWLLAVVKATLPFVAGFFGGLTSGCTVGGVGPFFG